MNQKFQKWSEIITYTLVVNMSQQDRGVLLMIQTLKPPCFEKNIYLGDNLTEKIEHI